MIKVPEPGSWSSAYTLAWDAWNRLVKVADGASTVAEYQYDGLNRRIVKRLYASGVHDHDAHFYLSEQNQVLEVRKDSSTNPLRQYTWGTRYIDDLLLRTRDTDSNGTLDETLYALQDANWNITALADTSGTVVERFQYDPYGHSTVLDATFAADADGESDYAWDYRFTSREWDAETGLHYFRARYYHDGLGRFVGRDPLEYVDGGSLYCAYFVPQSVDPSGLAQPPGGPIGPEMSDWFKRGTRPDCVSSDQLRWYKQQAYKIIETNRRRMQGVRIGSERSRRIVRNSLTNIREQRRRIGMINRELARRAAAAAAGAAWRCLKACARVPMILVLPPNHFPTRGNPTSRPTT